MWEVAHNLSRLCNNALSRRYHAKFSQNYRIEDDDNNRRQTSTSDRLFHTIEDFKERSERLILKRDISQRLERGNYLQRENDDEFSFFPFFFVNANNASLNARDRSIPVISRAARIIYPQIQFI